MARSQYALPTETAGSKHDPRGLEGYIREAARKNGIDPDVAVKVAKSEGLRDFSGDNGKSGGAFQLYTGGGLGNEFQKSTGLDPLDPKNEKATIDYAMQQAAKTGWGPWHGAKKVGVGEFDGISGGAGAGAAGDKGTSTAVADAAGGPAEGGVDIKGTDTSTVAPAAATDASAAASGGPPSDFLTKLQDPKGNASAGLGEAISGLGQAVAGTGLNKNPYATPASATTIAAPGMMTPQMVPMVDPRVAESQRQQLALAMQRLNSGRLY